MRFERRGSPSELSNSVRNEARITARYLLRLREAARSYFGTAVLPAPAWNLILALYTLDDPLDGCRIALLVKRASLPPTTALRWLQTLERNGLVILTPDQTDRRSTRARLTPEALKNLESCFVAATLAAKYPD